MHIFMRLQINYIHAMDYAKGRKPFRVFTVLDSKRNAVFTNYYLTKSPQQQLGLTTV
jgi:hypothetical protein